MSNGWPQAERSGDEDRDVKKEVDVETNPEKGNPDTETWFVVCIVLFETLHAIKTYFSQFGKVDLSVSLAVQINLLGSAFQKNLRLFLRKRGFRVVDVPNSFWMSS